MWIENYVLLSQFRLIVTQFNWMFICFLFTTLWSQYHLRILNFKVFQFNCEILNFPFFFTSAIHWFSHQLIVFFSSCVYYNMCSRSNEMWVELENQTIVSSDLSASHSLIYSLHHILSYPFHQSYPLEFGAAAIYRFAFYDACQN